MQITTFAAIEIGTYSTSMEIFEISKKQGLRTVNSLRHRLELGKDAFRTGKISVEFVEQLCRILKDFKNVMQEYQVSAYRALGTSALREAENSLFVLGRIEQSAGTKVELLSNSEQRFYTYKGIAAKEAAFQKIIEKGTAILDVDGGSIQISLFDKDTLVTTQNIKMGSMRVRERLHEVQKKTIHYERLVQELIHNEIFSFKKMYLKDRKIENVIIRGDYFTRISEKNPSRTFSREEFQEWYQMVTRISPIELAVKVGIPHEYASLLQPSAIIYRELIEEMGAQTIWMPDVKLADGIAYDFAEKKKLLKSAHNFENDILMAARNIGKRYAVSKAHVLQVDKTATAIFDGMKKHHGLGDRERLLLQIAVLVHDCGKYISLGNVAECSYSIIMSTEIIGLSHAEREMIANIVRFNTLPLPSYEQLARESSFGKKQYLTVAKLTAILRLANALDRSHLQKMEEIKVALRDLELVITISAHQDYTLELGLLDEKKDFFEEIFHVRPVVKLKKLI